MIPTAGILGIFILGVGVGFYLYRELSRLVSKSRFGEGICGSCGVKAYVTKCARCGLSFAMCHYYSILGTDDPDPGALGKRRSKSLCVVCLSSKERETLERILGS